MDRTVAAGTGYIGQYPPALADVYENLATCADDLLLFMHHVPYTFVLHDGKTVTRYVYDAHYDGAATARIYALRWETVHGLVDEQRYQQVFKLSTCQAGHAIVWRDAVTKWFQYVSGIADRQGRVGNYLNRIEAENMTAVGYAPTDVHPWENASNSTAVVCNRTIPCTLTMVLEKPAGNYSITVQYFDYWTGKSQLELRLNGRLAAIGSPMTPFRPLCPISTLRARPAIVLLFQHPGEAGRCSHPSRRPRRHRTRPR